MWGGYFPSDKVDFFPLSSSSILITIYKVSSNFRIPALFKSDVQVQHQILFVSLRLTTSRAVVRKLSEMGDQVLKTILSISAAVCRTSISPDV